MSAPRSAPAGLRETPYYRSPDVVPSPWMPDRPGEVDGPQPWGPRLGTPGPDQGYALVLARRVAPELALRPGDDIEDVIQGCLGIALKRAALYGRAPVIHDWRLAFTIWGYFDPEPPDELLAVRRRLFEGVSNTLHHYGEARHITDMVPEATLRLTPALADSHYPERWRSLIGLGSADEA